MPRSKKVRRSNATKKSSIKRSKTKNAATSTQKMEKDFVKTQSKMLVQLNKEIRALRKQENKLKVAINKANAQIKKSEAKLKAAESKPSTSRAAKKRLKTVTKSHDKTLKNQNDLNKQLLDIRTSLEAINHQHDKMVALGKLLSQFQQEWSINSKRPEAATTSKKDNDGKIKKWTPKAKSKVKNEQPSNNAPAEIALDEISIDESTEIAS